MPVTCPSHARYVPVTGELKLGHTAEMNGHLAAANIAALAGGGAEAPLLTYPHGAVGAPTTPKIFCLSLGRYHASLGFNWLVVNGVLPCVTCVTYRYLPLLTVTYRYLPLQVNGVLPAIFKWLLEWTKVAAAQERPVGLLFWRVADFSSNLLSRTLIGPDA